MSRIHDALRKIEQEKAAGRIRTNDALSSQAPVSAEPQTSGPVPGTMTAALGDLRVLESRLETMDLGRALGEKTTRPAWIPDRKTMLLFDRRKVIVGLEEFRTLRSHLDLIGRQQPVRKLLVTSPLPSEGKTFIAANLSQVVVRQPERRALLVDADLRSPHLHNFLGAPDKPGLADYLMGSSDEFSIIQRGPADNFFFIPAGTRVPNPSELIGNGRLSKLLELLEPAFDRIILDSPPALPVADTKLLAGFCDGVLLVVLAGSTLFPLAQKALQQFPEERRLGVVINQADTSETYGSRYYKDAPSSIST